MQSRDEKLAEARQKGIALGDRIEVEYRDGATIEGIWTHHPIAGWCVKLPSGIPMNYRRIVRKVS